MSDVKEKKNIRNMYKHILLAQFKMSPKTEGQKTIVNAPYANMDAEYWVENTAVGSPVPFEYARALGGMEDGGILFEAFITMLAGSCQYLSAMVEKYLKEKNMMIERLRQETPVKIPLTMKIIGFVPTMMTTSINCEIKFKLENEEKETDDTNRIIEAFGVYPIGQFIKCVQAVILEADTDMKTGNPILSPDGGKSA